MATQTLMTAEEFAALPDDGWRYELIRGVVRRMPDGGLEHGDVGSEFLLLVLRSYVKSAGSGVVVGETGFVFERNPDIVRFHDVAFIRSSRLPPRDQWAPFSRVVPDLVVEVVSPNDEPAQVAAKVNFYLAHGVPLVWVAYPRSRQIVVRRPGEEPRVLGVGDTLEGEEIIPGFHVPVADIFG